MASNSKRDSERFFFQANCRPHFFKIILEETTTGDDGKLCIPSKFVRNHGNDLANPVFLEVPTGAKWEVELNKCDGEVWLQNGWREFANYYSVSDGYFLVFEYESRCHLKVVIFDKSATEIKYRFSLNNGSEEPHLDGEFLEPKKEETEDDVSVEIIDDISPFRKSKEKSQIPCPRPHKMMKTNFTSCELESTSKLKTSVSPTISHSFRINERNSTRKVNAHCPAQHFEELIGSRSLSNQKQRLNEVIRREQSLTTDEKADALRKVSAAFKSINPFFMIAMQPSYVLPGSGLTIPYKFAQSYFNKSSGHVMLKVSDGRSWIVQYRYDIISGQPKAKFLCSWKQFVLDNNLEVGDVCVFELIKGIRISLEVSIFRAIEEASWSQLLIHLRGAYQVKPRKSLEEVENPCSHCNECTNQELQLPESNFNIETDKLGKSMLQMTDKFVSTYPFFKVVLRLYHFEHSNVSVPFRFAERYAKDKEQILVLQIANRSWPVKFTIYSSSRSAKLSSGWKVFARENSLQLGDVCAFEMIKSGLLKVTIFRKVC